jgi:hypothetical protein
MTQYSILFPNEAELRKDFGVAMWTIVPPNVRGKGRLALGARRPLDEGLGIATICDIDHSGKDWQPNGLETR